MGKASGNCLEGWREVKGDLLCYSLLKKKERGNVLIWTCNVGEIVGKGMKKQNKRMTTNCERINTRKS